MMNEIRIDPLAEYTTAFLALEAWKGEWHHILAKLRTLETELAEADTALKAHARIVGPLENDTIAVKVNAAPKKRVWDAGKLLEKLPWLKSVPGIISMAVDDKALQRQFKTSNIDESTVADALTVTEGTAAVLIRVKAPEAH